MKRGCCVCTLCSECTQGSEASWRSNLSDKLAKNCTSGVNMKRKLSRKTNMAKTPTRFAFYYTNPLFLGKYYWYTDIRRSRCIVLHNWQYDELLKTLYFTPKFLCFHGHICIEVFANSGVHPWVTGTVEDAKMSWWKLKLLIFCQCEITSIDEGAHLSHLPYRHADRVWTCYF